MTIYARATKLFNNNSQLDKSIEEMSELIHAIQNYKRGMEHNIPEKIADVSMCLEQLMYIFKCHYEVEGWKLIKIKRLGEILNEKEKNIM